MRGGIPSTLQYCVAHLHGTWYGANTNDAIYTPKGSVVGTLMILCTKHTSIGWCSRNTNDLCAKYTSKGGVMETLTSLCAKQTSGGSVIGTLMSFCAQHTSSGRVLNTLVVLSSLLVGFECAIMQKVWWCVCHTHLL